MVAWWRKKSKKKKKKSFQIFFLLLLNFVYPTSVQQRPFLLAIETEYNAWRAGFFDVCVPL